MTDNTKLSSSTTIVRYKKLVASGNRKALALFIVERFNERYFWPIENSSTKHGFASLAVACLIIETLESFYQGFPDTRNCSAQMFRDFFTRDTELKVFAGGNDWFYRDIRCGILHQSESRGGWRVLRIGPLLDKSGKSINATAFLLALKRAVLQYAGKLESEEMVWQNFRTKMKTVCANCL